MVIGICDDNAQDRLKLVDWLTNQKTVSGRPELHEFSCGEALLEHLRRGRMDILFLDGKMDGISGIQTAEKIREYNKNLIIIMFSDYVNYAVDGYGVHIYDFIIKRDFSQRIDHVFHKAVRFLDESRLSAYTIKRFGAEFNIRTIEILYIESRKHKLILVLRDKKTHEYYGKLDEAEQELRRHGFIRIHKSFLINCNFLRCIESAKVGLHDGQELPVSRDYYNRALSDFTLFAAGVTL